MPGSTSCNLFLSQFVRLPSARHSPSSSSNTAVSLMTFGAQSSGRYAESLAVGKATMNNDGLRTQHAVFLPGLPGWRYVLQSPAHRVVSCYTESQSLPVQGWCPAGPAARHSSSLPRAVAIKKRCKDMKPIATQAMHHTAIAVHTLTMMRLLISAQRIVTCVAAPWQSFQRCYTSVTDLQVAAVWYLRHPHLVTCPADAGQCRLNTGGKAHLDVLFERCLYLRVGWGYAALPGRVGAVRCAQHILVVWRQPYSRAASR